MLLLLLFLRYMPVVSILEARRLARVGEPVRERRSRLMAAGNGTETEAPLWGVAAEFATPAAMVSAIASLRDRGLGRPDAFSPDAGARRWPVFVIPSVPFALLIGALAVLLALLVLNRLPRLNHPAFNIPHFGRAAQDRFFVVVEARGEGFDPEAAEQAFAALPSRPVAISRVPR